MKQHWEVEELIEYWILLPSEMALLRNKTGAKRIGFAVCFKYFQLFNQFPEDLNQIPHVVINYIASQVNVSSSLYLEYDWQERSSRYHREQIRQYFGFRLVQELDLQKLKNYLLSDILPQEQREEHLITVVEQYFQESKIELPSDKILLRLIHSASRQFEDELFETICQSLSDETRTNIDNLLITSDKENEEGSYDKPSLFSYLNLDPGRVSLDSFFSEVDKLEQKRSLKLPENLFNNLSKKVLETYARRAATEPPRELRSHPTTIRYTLVSAFCWLRLQEVTDNLVDLLISIIHSIGRRAERKVDLELIKDFKKVTGKNHLLYQIANASLEKPDGAVKEVIFPVVDEKTLLNLVKEFKSKGTAYRQKVHTIIRSSYSRHYRRLVPKLLSMLEFHSNNEIHRPVIKSLEVLKKYADSQQRYYPIDDSIPIDGVLKAGWQEFLIETDNKGNERINRINYEISVLQALRERLRCKEIWVVGASRYRNPDEDLPTDFEQHRETYYQALKLPMDVDSFITPLKTALSSGMISFNEGIPKNKKVKILDKKNGWISVSPLDKQTEPVNILRLKSELVQKWPMTSLLDVLKEADLRIGFTDSFKSFASREVLERDVLQKRLLLCLYGLGTNTGLKRVSDGTPDIDYHELRYIKRRFIHL